MGLKTHTIDFLDPITKHYRDDGTKLPEYISNIYLTLCIFYITLYIEVNGMGKNLRFKSARAAKDLSQKELAEIVSVTRQTINAIENGDYNPSIRLCIAICKALNKTLDQIFWEDDDHAE